MSRFYTFLFYLLYIPFGLVAQNLPNTNVYLFDINATSDSTYEFKNAQLLTGFNVDGYNNQPFFTRDDELFLTVGLPGKGQTDIYRLDLLERTKLQVTKTAESEYSPTLMPDGINFSAIRVENDGRQSQRLWSFPISRSNNGKPIFPSVTNIGYHYWLDNYRVAMFIVGEPNYLAVGDIRDGSIEDLTPNIGRGFQPSPAGGLAYIHKSSDAVWYIKELSPGNLRSRVIAPTLEGSEDFAVMPDGTILMGRGSKLYKYHPKKDIEWVEIGDFRYYDINAISRIAVNGRGQMVIVGS